MSNLRRMRPLTTSQRRAAACISTAAAGCSGLLQVDGAGAGVGTQSVSGGRQAMGSSTMESLNGADTCEMCCWNGVPNASFDFAGCTLAVSMVGGAGSVAAGASAFAGCML
eukprot:1150528-Prymnesium_polylepis.2